VSALRVRGAWYVVRGDDDRMVFGSWLVARKSDMISFRLSTDRVRFKPLTLKRLRVSDSGTLAFISAWTPDLGRLSRPRPGNRKRAASGLWLVVVVRGLWLVTCSL